MFHVEHSFCNHRVREAELTNLTKSVHHVPAHHWSVFPKDAKQRNNGVGQDIGNTPKIETTSYYS